MPPTLLQYIPLAALVISILALFISFANLGWNMYRELALRGRLKVSLKVWTTIGGNLNRPVTRVVLSGTNFGPGSINVLQTAIKKAGLWRRISRRIERGVTTWDYNDPSSSHLPCKLEVGESIDLTLVYGSELHLDPGTTHIGLRDSFGRYHWAPCRDVRGFQKQRERRLKAKG